MVRVRMNMAMAGPHVAAAAGQVVELSSEQAAELIKGGYAQAVKCGRETATVRAPENTAAAAALEVTVRAAELAAEHGIDLAEIADLGTDGKVTVPDVRRHLKRVGEAG